MKSSIWIDASSKGSALTAQILQKEGLHEVLVSGPERMSQCGPDYVVEPNEENLLDMDCTFEDWLFSLCKNKSVKCLISGRDSIRISLSSHKFSNSGIRVFCGARDWPMIETANDRAAFHDLMAGHGIPSISCKSPTSIEELQAIIGHLTPGNPATVNHRYTDGGDWSWILDPSASSAQHVLEPDQRRIHPDVFAAAYENIEEFPEIAVSERRNGLKWTVDCACVSGRIAASAAYRLTEGIPFEENPRDALKLACSVAEAMTLDGLVSINIIETPTGEMFAAGVKTSPSTHIGDFGGHLPSALIEAANAEPDPHEILKICA